MRLHGEPEPRAVARETQQPRGVIEEAARVQHAQATCGEVRERVLGALEQPLVGAAERHRDRVDREVPAAADPPRRCPDDLRQRSGRGIELRPADGEVDAAPLPLHRRPCRSARGGSRSARGGGRRRGCTERPASSRASSRAASAATTTSSSRGPVRAAGRGPRRRRGRCPRARAPRRSSSGPPGWPARPRAPARRWRRSRRMRPSGGRARRSQPSRTGMPAAARWALASATLKRP